MNWKAVGWFVLNACQVFFFFVWSIIWQTISICIRLIPIKADHALCLANRVWGPALCYITGSTITIANEERLDLSKPHIYVLNHQSTLDIAVAFTVIQTPLRFVAKKELSYVPFLGWYMNAMGMVFVDRKRSKKAIESLKRAGELIRNGADIVAYPEGTRSPDGSIRPLKKGIFVVAIEAGVPIVPVALEGTYKVMPKNTFRVRPAEIKVAIGEPISTAEYAYEDRERLAQKVYDELVDLHLSIGGKGAQTPS